MRILLAALAALLIWPATSVAVAREAEELASPVLQLEPVVAGLDVPVHVTNAGDGSGRMFVVERAGRIRVVQDGALLPEPFLDLTGIAHTDDDKMGLLGLVFHPDYPRNNTFFVTYTSGDSTNILARYRLSSDPNRADPESGEILLSIPDRIADHNLGMLAFGSNGYLYLSSGDEGSHGDPYGNAQDLGSLYGKVLRIDINTGSGYAIPPSNPFVNAPGVRPEIWAYGLRSPWRFSFDRATGDLYLGDVGESSWEEINFQSAGDPGGANYGWNVVEGPACYPPGSACDSSAFVTPIHTYSHATGCAVTGGYVYRGMDSPLLEGAYVFGDFCTGVISTLRWGAAGAWERADLLDTDLMITSFGEDEAGELYLTDIRHGALFRLVMFDGYPSPTISETRPGSVPAGSAEQPVQVWGSGFAPDAVVLWNGVPRETTWESSALLTVTAHAADLSVAGAVEVRVRNAALGDVSNAAIFKVTPPEFASAAFARVWARSDQPVAAGEVSRTWLWGPAPFSGVLLEQYDESPGGTRLVQYFDKARMEVTDPDGDPSSDWYVTTGLLVVELVTGRMQVGDGAWQARDPAGVNVAGDLDDPSGPTYATIGLLLDAPAAKMGAAITQRLARDGTASLDPTLARHGVIAAAQDELTRHSIASVFWEALNSTTNSAFGGLYAVGRPIAEPYWARVAVGGVPRDVLIQCFERRCLTWTPDNPPGWQIEAGNVGLHYFRWRYGEG